MIKMNVNTVGGLLVVSVILALVVKYYNDLDYTITSLAPNFYTFTKQLQGR